MKPETENLQATVQRLKNWAVIQGHKVLHHLLWAGVGMGISLTQVWGQPLRQSFAIPHAPPPASPVLHRNFPNFVERAELKSTAGLTQYSIGEPAPEEQLYVELVNRARANPAAEGARLKATTNLDIWSSYNFYQVDLDLMVAQFAVIPASPPLSINAKLTAAARVHSQDMFDHEFQEHAGTDGSDPGSRVTLQGYNWSNLGENIFSYAKSVWHGHAGFEVDWGNGPGGMQTPPGHRQHIHDPLYHEIGVGVVLGTHGTVGPQVVTEEFASPASSQAFITGVVYYDLNTNSFYDLGEGIGGIQVTVTGSDYFAVSANSGGYSVPVNNDGNYTVTFSVPGLPDAQKTVTVSNQQNMKVDFIPSYQPAVIAGPDTPAIGWSNGYQFSVVGGAQGYQWRQAQRVATNLLNGAESGLAGLTLNVTPGYDVIANDVRYTGTSSFHLAQPEPITNQPPISQTLMFDQVLRASANTTLAFQSRLGYAATGQVARVQISLDQGGSWQDIWTQPGTGDQGEVSFSPQSVSLAAFGGADFILRFNYDFVGDSYFWQTVAGVGWYIDNISIAGADALVNEIIADVSTGNSFAFVPTAPGDYLLNVRPKVSNRFLNWGPEKLVQAVDQGPPPTTIQIRRLRFASGNQVQLDFTVTPEAPAAPYSLESVSSANGSWKKENSAQIQNLGAGLYQALAPADNTEQKFYRVRAN